MIIKYYYCPDFNKFVKYEDGEFFSIEDGRLKSNTFYDKMFLGDIHAIEINEEEFNAQLH